MKFLTVCYAATELESQTLKGFLEAQGVEVFIFNHGSYRSSQSLLQNFGEISINVSEDQFHQAEQLLADLKSGAFEDIELLGVHEPENVNDHENEE